MPFIPVTNVAEADMNFTLDGEQMQMTFYGLYNAQPTIPELGTFGEILAAWFISDLDGAVHSGCILQNVTVTDLTEPSGHQYIASTDLPHAGVAGGAHLPNNVAIVVSKRTNRTGRSYRGRNYISGLTGANLADDNHITSALQTLLTLAYFNLKDLLETEGIDMVVVSRYSGGLPRDLGVSELVTNFTVDTTLDSQRRRLPGRGA